MLPRRPLVVTARHEAGIQVKEFCDTLPAIDGFILPDNADFIVKFFKEKEEDLAQKLIVKLKSDKGLEEPFANRLKTLRFFTLFAKTFRGRFQKVEHSCMWK